MLDASGCIVVGKQGGHLHLGGLQAGGGPPVPPPKPGSKGGAGAGGAGGVGAAGGQGKGSEGHGGTGAGGSEWSPLKGGCPFALTGVTVTVDRVYCMTI